MTKTKAIITAEELKQALTQDSDFLKPLVQLVLQEVLEAEMEDTLGAGKGERVEGRKGYRSGYYTRGLITRVGKLELRVPKTLWACPECRERMHIKEWRTRR